jgi:hypothetical protein
MRLTAPGQDDFAHEIALMRLVTVLSILLSVALP